MDSVPNRDIIPIESNSGREEQMKQKNEYTTKYKRPLRVSAALVLALVFTLNTFALQSEYVSAKTLTFYDASPNKKTVSVLNKTIRRWSKNYKSGTTKKYYKKGEVSIPADITLSWKTSRHFSRSFTVLVSTRKNLSKAKKYKTKSKKLRLTNLYAGKKYYWRVTGIRWGEKVNSKTYSFRTARTARLLKAKKVSNLRDMGAYKVAGKKKIRQGKIFRSGNMDSAGKSGKKTLLKDLKLKTDLDLRRPDERKTGNKSPLGRKVKYIHISGIMYEELWKVTGRKGSSDSIELNRQTLIKEMKVFANKSNYPIVFHCTYGRDRTGTLAFTLGALLGMKKKDLYKDYEITFFSKVSSKSKINLKKRLARFDSLYRYMSTYDDPEKSLQYNTQRFLIDNGMTAGQINKIKAIMLY